MTTNTLFTSTQTIKISTASETSTLVVSWMTTPVQIITSHVLSPSPTSSGRSADGDHIAIVVTVGVTVVGIIPSIIIVAIIICALKRLVHIYYDVVL